MIVYIEILFWLSAIWIAYIYIGYPLLLYIINRLPVNELNEFTPETATQPKVSVFIPAYNEETVIRQKIQSTLDSNYPADKIEILVASDASSDATNTIVESFNDRRVRLFVAEENLGKNGLINRYIPEATGDILIFTDANAIFAPDAIKLLSAAFAMPQVDCVGGRLIYLTSDSMTAKGEGAYYKYENKIRHLEAQSGHLMGVNGALYALRTAAFIPVPTHVPNDFFHPLCILAKGRKVTFRSNAVAREKATELANEEFARRSRIVTRALVTYDAVKEAVAPLRGRALFNYISHRLLRWYGFIPISIASAGSIFLAVNDSALPYQLAAFGTIIIYIMLLIGWATNHFGIKIKLVNIPFYFFLINSAAAVGVLNFLRSKRIERWTPSASTR